MTQPETKTSTQETENREAEANLLWLAELMVECPSPCRDGLNTLTVFSDKQSTWPCKTCQGTGQVAKHETLRRHTYHNRIMYGHASERQEDIKQTWVPVSREKAGTEIRKMEEFRDWLYQQLLNPPVSRKGREHKMAVSTVIDLLCNDNATIAALKKMEEHDGR